MSYFYGTVQGNRGEGTRGGSKASGLETYCASWNGAVKCRVYFNEEKKQDWVRVELTQWHGEGVNRLLYEGAINDGRK